MVTLVDTSVWVSFLRGDGSPAHHWLRKAVAEPGDIVTTEPVLMELLAGAGTTTIGRLEAVFSRMETVSVRVESDFRDAGILARTARRHGLTVRSIVDCLTAAVALRCGLSVAHRDADYEALADIAPLQTLDLR